MGKLGQVCASWGQCFSVHSLCITYRLRLSDLSITDIILKTLQLFFIFCDKMLFIGCTKPVHTEGSLRSPSVTGKGRPFRPLKSIKNTGIFMTEKRTKSIKIRLTDDERKKLDQLKVGAELATWIRETCLGKKSKRRTAPPSVDPQLLRALSALGNNVNQIARQCNAKLSPSDVIEVLVRLDAVESTLDKLRNHYDSKNT